MKINKWLQQYDPSRYTVYQMLAYTQKIRDIRLRQKKQWNMYMFQTRPFINSLYNYAHLLDKKIDSKDIRSLPKFFAKNPYRIKCPENKKTTELLLSLWYTYKDCGYIMTANIANKKEEIILPKNIKIIRVKNKKMLNEYKWIFKEAFDCTLQDTNQKFGFLDSIIIDETNDHINTFILYKNNKAVSTWAYFAFDNFSIENIGTKKAYRGKWYAHLIMRHLIEEAKRLKYRQACLVASEAWSHVYEKVGFHVKTKTNTFI